MDVDGISLASCDHRLDLPIHPSPPISRLPAEILENIFIHSAHDSCANKRRRHPNSAMPSWVNVSYVCRLWRNIALNCQTLWTYIPTTSHRWTQELLARSRNAPLNIYSTFSVEYADRLSHVLSIVKQLMNHSHRIQKLHLNLSGVIAKYNYKILSTFLSSRLPCLQQLEISHFYLVPEEETFLPFEENTPALCTLKLDCCSMPWNSLELSALTALHLHRAKLPLSQNITLAEFLAMLGRMPHLIQLSIHDTLPSDGDLFSSGESNASQMINLSRLSDMSIRGPIWAVNAFLSCVDISLTTKVDLGLELERASDFITHADLTRLASLLGQRVNLSYGPTPAVPTFRSLTINIRSVCTTLTFSTSERTGSECFDSSMFSHGSDENTHLWVHFNAPFPGPGGVSNRICPPIPFTSIRSIHFIRPIPLLEFWRNTLASFPNVRHIKLTECNIMKMASILSLRSQGCSGNKDGPVDGDQNMVLVPALEELELDRVTFSKVDSVSDLDILCEAISTRKETRCRLTVKQSRLSTNGNSEGSELVGWWEDDQFRVTRRTS